MTGPIGSREVIVIGGGAAGLSAALTLGRARRDTLVLDEGRQSNLAAPTNGGLLGHDGVAPAAYYATAQAELAAYGTVERRATSVSHATREEDGTFTLTTSDGACERARRLVVATGTDYRYPDVPGIAPRWGGAAFHCPFCHGWEVRGEPLGVLADGPVGLHGALNLRAWSGSITLLTNGPSTLDDAQRDQLAAGGVALDERPLTALEGPGQELSRVSFTDGPDLAVHGLLVKTVLRQRGTLARELGLTVLEPDEMLSVEAIRVDSRQQTDVAGVAAAGDAALTVPPSVAAAVSSGHLAAAVTAVQLVAGY